MSVRIIAAVPQLPSTNLEAAKKFYRDKLGFTIVADQPDLLIVTRNEVELQLWPCADSNIAEHSGCYFYVDDVDAFYREYKHLPCLINRPQDQARGTREFSLLDDSGNLLVFGQRITV